MQISQTKQYVQSDLYDFPSLVIFNGCYMLIQANKHLHNGKHKKKQMSKLNKKENNNNTTDMFFYINQYLLLKKKNICNKKLFFFIFNLATSLEMYMIFFLLCLLFHTLYISFKVFGILPFWYFNDDERRIVI